MADSYGDYNPTTLNALGDGRKVNAAVRMFHKKFNLATDADPAGGAANRLHVARIPKGSVLAPEFKIGATVDCSGITFGLGITGTAAKYAATVTGPAANATVSRDILPVEQGVVLTEEVDLWLTPSGNLPASGIINVFLLAAHR